MTPREIIARHLCTMAAQGWSGISAFERAAYRTTAAGMVEAITSAGYRILGPGELDPETVEKCAEVAEAHSAELWPKARKPNRSELDVAIFESAASEADAIATAIRALAKEKQG